ncbi:thioesterase family protein [Comamonas flocculans]|uniref:Thioesterase family protein n=2 Tax=Comamonas flocculans TaxID=2597701 RepID=A0A5B8RUT9_9BURK|nr:thioesterase family protein [Comamonas flocculans]
MDARPMPTATTTDPFDAEFMALLRELFEEKIVFNRTLGLEVTQVAAGHARGRIAMRPELVGHFAYNRLHGGAISAALDAMGGLAIIAAMAARHADKTPEQRLQYFSRLGTIDLRVDYLRAAIGPSFELQAQVLRLGSRVASTRMECLGADGQLLATGAASYIVA